MEIAEEITEKEIKSCFPTNIKTKIYSGYDYWEIHFQIDYCNFILYINRTLSTTNIGSVWYTAHLYIKGNHNFELNYGFSNYVDDYKYILKAIYLDLDSFEKTGEFSKYAKTYHNMFSPEDFKNKNN